MPGSEGTIASSITMPPLCMSPVPAQPASSTAAPSRKFLMSPPSIQQIAPLRRIALARLSRETGFGEGMQRADGVAHERRGAAGGVGVRRHAQRLLQRGLEAVEEL